MWYKKIIAAALFSAFSLGATAAEVSQKAVLEQYSTIVLANYQDSLASARDLQSKINAFTAQPSAEGLKAAQAAWLEAREWIRSN